MPAEVFLITACKRSYTRYESLTLTLTLTLSYHVPPPGPLSRGGRRPSVRAPGGKPLWGDGTRRLGFFFVAIPLPQVRIEGGTRAAWATRERLRAEFCPLPGSLYYPFTEGGSLRQGG
jgi:hypothetical protein